MAHKETLINWLNDAYGMEQNMINVIEDHASVAKDYPDLHSRMQDHLEKTRCHAGLVKECIERLGGNVSSLKSGIGAITGAVQGMVSAPAEDQMVKNCLADYAAEHFEIGSYKSLMAAAQEYGDEHIVRACQSILRDEEEMARYLSETLPTVTLEYYRKQTGEHRQAA